MAIMEIITVPNPVLRQKAEPVEVVNDDIRNLLDNMLETMYEARGVGLAAPQVGISKRVVVIDCSKAKDEPFMMVNPRIIWRSEEMSDEEEACLSIPEQYADVVRSCEVEVEYLDYHGEVQKLKVDGLLSICVQHELDHLDGVLFIDRLSSLKRNIILRKLKKLGRK